MFSKTLEDIHLVAEYLFEVQNVNPSEVGEACFDKILKEAK